MEKRNYEWFAKRRRTKGLDLAQEQITKALDTVTLLNKAMKSFSTGDLKETMKHVNNLYAAEEQVDRLRTDVFTELSKGAALMADYREDLLHVVKRLDTLADHTKDAARCLGMLGDAQIPSEISQKTVSMTSKLVETAQTLRLSIAKVSSNPVEAIALAKKVQDIEHDLDVEYLETKSQFVKHGTEINCGAMVIFDDLVEFIEQAADMCADTADYIIVLSTED